MNDLFQSIQEAKDELQGNKMADGITTTADELHRCEIQAVMRRCYPDGNKAKEYFELVESKRGKSSADKLRDDCRKAWQIEVDNHKAMREKAEKDSQVNK